MHIIKFHYLNENLFKIHKSQHNSSPNLIPIPKSNLKPNPRLNSRLKPMSMYNSSKKLIQTQRVTLY